MRHYYNISNRSKLESKVYASLNKTTLDSRSMALRGDAQTDGLGFVCLRLLFIGIEWVNCTV